MIIRVCIGGLFIFFHISVSYFKMIGTRITIGMGETISCEVYISAKILASHAAC